MWSGCPTNSGSFQWKSWRNRFCVIHPSSLVWGGSDCDGTPMYVGRAHYHGDLIPAKVMPAKKVAYIPWGGQEISISDCEVLCNTQSFQWVPSSNGVVPPNSVPVGHLSTGEPLYCGRTHHGGSQCIGKIHPSHHCLYIPFGGKELSFSNYEVLVTYQSYNPPPPYTPYPNHHHDHHHGHHDHHHGHHNHPGHHPVRPFLNINLGFGRK